MRTTYPLLFVLIMAMAITSSCRKDSILTDSSAKLEFSTDSIVFDTVFTSIGSATMNFRIYNRNNKKLVISNIRLGGGAASSYRINVDGIPGTQFRDMEIPAKDSLWVFVEVTIDPNSQATPYIVTDSVIFETNGNTQKVNLVAWGQNAYFHYNTTGQPVTIFGFECYSCFPVCDETWATDKPHIVFGYAVVDSACKLTIPAGARVYFYNNGGLLVYKAASLEVNPTGTAMDEPVRFEGFRREQYLADVPGQWDRIWLMPGSRNNIINKAIIKNGFIGLQVDTVVNSQPTLQMHNTVIKNMTSTALFAQGADIEATNCVFSNSGQYLAALTLGGSYDFKHCTFANYWSFGARNTPSVVFNNYYIDANNQLQLRDLLKADFSNCIVYGSETNETGFDFKPGAQGSYLFNHCLVRTNLTYPAPNVINNVVNQDPKFKDNKDNYELKDGSPAVNTGDATVGSLVPTDIKGNSRTADAGPDKGAFEK